VLSCYRQSRKQTHSTHCSSGNLQSLVPFQGLLHLRQDNTAISLLSVYITLLICRGTGLHHDTHDVTGTNVHRTPFQMRMIPCNALTDTQRVPAAVLWLLRPGPTRRIHKLRGMPSAISTLCPPCRPLAARRPYSESEDSQPGNTQNVCRNMTTDVHSSSAVALSLWPQKAVAGPIPSRCINWYMWVNDR
jgi:hypothetical protein